MQSLLPRIMGFLVMIITLALAPTIYTSNTAILDWGDLTPFIGLEVTVSFGAFIIIFGLLISGGLFSIAGIRGKLGGAGTRDIMVVVGAVILVVIMLAIFPTMLDYVDDLITAAIAASDTIGEVGFGVIPVIVYAGVLGSVAFANVATYRRLSKGSRANAFA